MKKEETVQDLMIEELLNQEDEIEVMSNEMVGVLEFVRDNATPLTGAQLEAVYILNEYGLGDMAQFALSARSTVTPFKKYMDVINSITLGNRIRGNAKLSNLLKANMSSPMQTYQQDMSKINKDMRKSK